MKKRENYESLKLGLTGNNLQYYFRKANPWVNQIKSLFP